MILTQKKVPKTKQFKVTIPNNSHWLEVRVISGERFLFYHDSGETETMELTFRVKDVGDTIDPNTEFFNNFIGSAVLKGVYWVTNAS